MSGGIGGVSIRRVIDRSGARIPQHAHDWPLLSLFVIGAYSNHTEAGTAYIASPSAVFYAAGALHSNFVGPNGFEQIEIEFDPSWLRQSVPTRLPVMRFIGGRFGAFAKAIVKICGDDLREDLLLAALRNFFEASSSEPATRSPKWFAHVSRRLQEDPNARIIQLAEEVKLHPSWLGTAYKQVAGESFQDTAARLRVERATRMLRETDEPLVSVSAATGFYDQSHMTKSFRRVLGRSPTMIRAERRTFRSLPHESVDD